MPLILPLFSTLLCSYSVIFGFLTGNILVLGLVTAVRTGQGGVWGKQLTFMKSGSV